MTYSRIGDKVTLEMPPQDYDLLMMSLGYAMGITLQDPITAYCILDLVNRMNAGNPSFIPYEIPEQYRRTA